MDKAVQKKERKFVQQFWRNGELHTPEISRKITGSEISAYVFDRPAERKRVIFGPKWIGLTGGGGSSTEESALQYGVCYNIMAFVCVYTVFRYVLFSALTPLVLQSHVGDEPLEF